MFKFFSSEKNIGIWFEQVKGVEQAIIRKQRENRQRLSDGDKTDRPPQLGLSISGGGIRSASFSLGVVQGLHRCGLYDEVDYLSTVSGGGYTGSAITWFNYNREKLFSEGDAESVNAEAMFGMPTLGAKALGKQALDKHDFPDYIRQHGDYLTPCKQLSVLSLVGHVLANSLVAVTVYFSLLVAVMFLVVKTGVMSGNMPFFGKSFITGSWILDFSILLTGFSFLLALIYSFSSKCRAADSVAGYERRVNVQKVFGYLTLGALLFLALASMEPLRASLVKLVGSAKEGAGDESLFAQLSGLLTLVAGAAGALHEVLAVRSGKKKRGGFTIWVVAALLIYGLIYAAYLTAYHLSEPPGVALGTAWFWLFLGVGLIVGFLTNLNMFGINRMYRDRLMEAFMPDPAQVKKNRWDLSRRADQSMVVNMCGDGVFPDNWDTVDDLNLDNITTPGPYHIVNTNVVLTDSGEAKFRGRGGDNFVISPAYCGGDAINWQKTTDFVDGKMSQATAMAISGAAMNPGAGVGGRGVTRNRLISFMMAFFHLRLGWWLPNPAVRCALKAPNFIWPGLTQGVFSNNVREQSRFIELTDGGHFENTGIYELVRQQAARHYPVAGWRRSPFLAGRYRQCHRTGKS